MIITTDGLKILNEGRIFHICSTEHDLEKALDVLGGLALDLKQQEGISEIRNSQNSKSTQVGGRQY